MIRKLLLGILGLAISAASSATAAEYGRPQAPAVTRPGGRIAQRPPFHARPPFSMAAPISSVVGSSAARPAQATMPMEGQVIEPSAFEPTTFIDDSISCADGTCGGASCDSCAGDVFVDTFAVPCVTGCSPWSAGVEFTLVKPHFEGNPAFTQMTSDGTSFESFTDREFNYDTELAPRVWLEHMGSGDLGFRVVYWQFDHAAATAAGSPAANGFGSITHPVFGNVDLSTTVPNSTYTADSSLNAYTIDLEGTKYLSRGIWNITTSAGLRFAEVEQFYRSTLVSPQGQTQGTINYGHAVEGIGPTLAVRTQRPFSPRLSLFATGRASVLFGDGTSTLNAIEDQDLTNTFTTSFVTSRNDVMPVGELQVGFQVLPTMYGPWQPYVHVAMEGQLWGGAGNASGEAGNLGFYGLNVALGFDW